MDKCCEGRVVLVTGAGRGIGRGHAIEFARQGAKVVVNDLGSDVDGAGSSTGPAGEVVDEIRQMGGEAVANGDDVSDWEGAQRMVNTAVETFGGLDVLVNNAGILRDRMLVNMTDEEWDSVIKVHLRGTFAPAALGGHLLARACEAGPRQRRPHHQHQLGVGHLRQRRPDELWRREGRHRRVHRHRRQRARPLRRDGQRRRARRAPPV